MTADHEEIWNQMLDEIRSLYFPRWDRNKMWVIKLADRNLCRGESAYCDSKVKTIYVHESDFMGMKFEGIYAFVIHEICHDVGAARHGLGWAKRMEKAARRVESLGQNEIANQLRNHIYAYCEIDIFRSVTGLEICPYQT